MTPPSIERAVEILTSDTHFHIAGACEPMPFRALPGGGFVTPFLERCACGARRRAYYRTGLDGFTTFSWDLWEGGRAEGPFVPVLVGLHPPCATCGVYHASTVGCPIRADGGAV